MMGSGTKTQSGSDCAAAPGGAGGPVHNPRSGGGDGGAAGLWLRSQSPGQAGGTLLSPACVLIMHHRAATRGGGADTLRAPLGGVASRALGLGGTVSAGELFGPGRWPAYTLKNRPPWLLENKLHRDLEQW